MPASTPRSFRRTGDFFVDPHEGVAGAVFRVAGQAVIALDIALNGQIPIGLNDLHPGGRNLAFCNVIARPTRRHMLK